MTQVKICGICSPSDAIQAVEAGADLLGFHFCSSLRRVTPEAARNMIEALPVRPRLVGVFINQPPEEIDQVAAFCGLDLAQLHGSEPPGLAARVPLMKVLKVRGGIVPDADQWPDPLMLDSWSSDERGGTGRTWDWSLAGDLFRSRQVFLAGGLTPANVEEAVLGYRPYGVDVSSGVESHPRHKDPDLVRAFVRAAKGVPAR